VVELSRAEVLALRNLLEYAPYVPLEARGPLGIFERLLASSSRSPPAWAPSDPVGPSQQTHGAAIRAFASPTSTAHPTTQDTPEPLCRAWLLWVKGAPSARGPGLRAAPGRRPRRSPAAGRFLVHALATVTDRRVWRLTAG
jgi:hypothetical protein